MTNLDLFFIIICTFLHSCASDSSNSFISQCKDGTCNYVMKVKTDDMKHHNGSLTVSIPSLLREVSITKKILMGMIKVVQYEVKSRHNDSNVFRTHLAEMEDRYAKLANWTKSKIEQQNYKLESSHLKTPGNVSNGEIMGKGSTSSCASLYKSGVNDSGVYTLRLDGNTEIEVYCDMATDGGGWTVIQRRADGSDDFFRSWDTYKYGFGNLNHDFWLGLNYIHLLTKYGNNEMRVDLWDWENRTRFAQYDFVQIHNESDQFRIVAGGYHGNAGDPFNSKTYGQRMQSMPFSTFDKDNDMNAHASCAKAFTSGWWFNNCFRVNLNGVWYPSGSYYGTVANGIVWDLWTDHNSGYSLRKTEIKLRHEHF